MSDPYQIMRLLSFFVILAAMLLWETKKAHRSVPNRFNSRWRNNLVISVVNSLAVKLMGPISAISVAAWAASHEFGLLALVSLPSFVVGFIGVIVLDFTIYVQHLAAHRFSWFWRMHRMHHADPRFDVTTAVRFHPFEIVLSMFVKIAIVGLFGIPVVAVLVFEIILNGMALFNHGNVSLPAKVDNLLRYFVVTPDMHRIHHSVNPTEHHSNFGFNLSIWDKLFKTYTPAFADPSPKLGLPDYTNPKVHSTLFGMLAIPLKR